MTDEERNTRARPLEPRLKMPANPMMAQPVKPPDPEAVPDALPVEEPEQHEAKEVAPMPTAKPQPRPKEAEIETIASLDETPAPRPTAARSKPTAAASTKPAATSPKPSGTAATKSVSKRPIVQESLPVATPAVEPEPVQSASNEETAAAENLDFPRTVRDTLQRVDQSWDAFRAAAMRLPLQALDEHVSQDGWTRKQMLAHVAAWHDLTADRLVKLVNTGELTPLDRDTDQFNAAIARQAVGKTSGEVLKDMDATFSRLRRQIARMTDVQLEGNDWFAAWVIGGNTYGHYEEHWADVNRSGSLRR